MIRPDRVMYLLPFTLLLPIASADTISVCASGCDFTSINAAIAAADDGYVIELSAETYSEGINVDTMGKAITLRGATDADGNPTSILDGGGTHRLLICSSGEGPETRFENLMIQNGFFRGMLNTNGSSPTLVNCTFDNNSGSSVGSGMSNGFDSNPTLIDCTFTNNRAWESGGAMSNSGSSPTLIRCKFMNNMATPNGGFLRSNQGDGYTFGGAMFNGSGSNPIMVDCLFTGNSSLNLGGAIYNFEGSSPILSNCIVCENTVGGSASDANQIEGDPLSAESSDNCINDDCTVCEKVCPGDVTGDNFVNGEDLATLLAAWGQNVPEIELSGDDVINGQDLAVVLDAFGQACDG